MASNYYAGGARMIDIVAMAERYTAGKRGGTRKAAHEAFIAGAQALSVEIRRQMELKVDHARIAVPVGRRKKLSKGHQWFTP